MVPKMDRINLLFVIDHLGTGGAEYQLIELLNGLKREIFELNLFLTEGGGVRLKDLNNDIKIFGFIGDRRRKTLRALLELRKTIKKLNPHLIISWLEYSTFLTSLVLMTIKKPHIANILGNLDYIYAKEVKCGSLKKLLLKFAYNKAHILVFNSNEVAKRIKWLDNKKCFVIYNIFPIERVSQLPSKEEIRKKLNFRENLFYIIYVGSLVKRKGVDLLIEAFKKLKSENLRLLIIGQGDLEPALREIAKEDLRIEFLGYKENAISYIKASHLFVLPSFSEGIPNVLIEALACETPIVATDVDGIPEIIIHKRNGILIKPGSTELIKEAIEYAFNNYEEMKGYAQTGKEKVELFKKEIIIEKFGKLFKSSLSTTYRL